MESQGTRPTYTTIKHPVSGETYAALLTADGRIAGIAGPLHHSDATDEDSLAGWIANATEAEEDAEWMRRELAAAAREEV